MRILKTITICILIESIFLVGPMQAQDMRTMLAPRILSPNTHQLISREILEAKLIFSNDPFLWREALVFYVHEFKQKGAASLENLAGKTDDEAKKAVLLRAAKVLQLPGGTYIYILEQQY